MNYGGPAGEERKSEGDWSGDDENEISTPFDLGIDVQP